MGPHVPSYPNGSRRFVGEGFTPSRGLALAVLVLVVLLCLPGCVERTLAVRTEPPGARVFLDGQLVGSTRTGPVEVAFAFYGTREVLCRMAGRRSVARRVTLTRPWWGWPPIDLLAELWPTGLTDRHEVTVQLPGLEEAPGPEEVAGRAEAARAALEADEPLPLETDEASGR